MKKDDKNEEQLASGKKYAELLCDFMFKRLFGTEANKDVLIRFLNIVLEDVEIEDVDFISTEHYGMSEEDRKVIFDIGCKCKDGSSFIIEMQKGYQKHFRERALYYTTYPINEQARDAKDLYVKEKAESGGEARFKWDYNLKPGVVVAILNFQFRHMDEWPADKYRSSYRLREDSFHTDLMTDALRFVFIELGRFNKCIWELDTFFERWLYLLKHIHEMDAIPKQFTDPFFHRLFILAEINNFTAEEKRQYLQSLENMGDYDNIINTAAEEAHAAGKAEGLEQGLQQGLEQGLQQGLEQGLQQGLEQGSRQANLQSAKNLKALGVAVDVIAQATGLSVEEIESL